MSLKNAVQRLSAFKVQKKTHLGQVLPFSQTQKSKLAVLGTLPPDLDFSKEVTGKVGARSSQQVSAQQQASPDFNLVSMEHSLKSLAAMNTITRGMIGRPVTIGATAVQIIQSQFPKGYIILNPATLLGFTSTGTLLASAARTADGNTQASSLGVANFRDMHMFLNISAVSGTAPTLDIISQAKDPVSGNWADINTLWSGLTTAGTYYANIAGLGLASDFAIRWVIGGSATPTFTFSVGYVVKDGLPGTAAGVNKTVYLGDRGVTTTSGFPLLEGQSRSFVVNENTELWAVADSSLELRIFEL